MADGVESVGRMSRLEKTPTVIENSFAIVSTGKAKSGFTVYKIRFKIATLDLEGNPIIQELETKKRFSDFQNLSKQLEVLHAHSMSKIKFKSLVKAKYWERFKETVIEERRKSAQDMLQFITHHPHLIDSIPLQQFIDGARVKKITPDSSDANAYTRANHLALSSLRTTDISPSSLLQSNTNKSEQTRPPSQSWDEEGLSVGGSDASSAAKTEFNSDNLAPVLDLTLSSEASSKAEGSWENLLSDSDSISLENVDGALDETNAGKSEDHSSDTGPASRNTGSTSENPLPNNGDLGESSKGNGMSWWTDALAETANIADDLDELVDKLEDNKEELTVKDVPKSNAQGMNINSIHEGKGSLQNSQQNSPHSSRQASLSPSPSSQRRRPSPSAKLASAYIIQAGRLINQALSYEKEGEYDEAFDLLKAGVDVLLNGVQTDDSKERREMVRRKTSEYLLYAENLQQKILSKDSKVETAESQVPAPSNAKPHHLQDFKVKAILGRVMSVESKHTGQIYVFKVLHKSLKAMAALPRGRPKNTKNRSPLQCPYMVKLLHHYETPNHRIFLLLEHIARGRLLDFVTAKRVQWRRLREAASNPPPSSSLLTNMKQLEQSIKEIKTEEKRSTREEDEDNGDEEDDLELELMLSELTSIVPPKSFPPESSLQGDEDDDEDDNEVEDSADGGDEESLDVLALMRKRLEESMLDADSRTDDTKEDTNDLAASTNEELDSEKAQDDEKVLDTDTSINILPPTPTIHRDMLAVNTTNPKDSLNMDSLTVKLGSSAGEQSSPTTASHGQSESVAILKTEDESTDQGLFFSPASSQNSPDLKKVDDWNQRLEDSVRHWAAQIILALEHLHNHKIVCRDLHTDNILLNDKGQAVLTYFGKWDFVENTDNIELAKMLYIAPELQSLDSATDASDWWSLGAFLFELLTGETLVSCHPGGVHSHLPLRIPVSLSSEAQSLLKQLLQVSPTERLGSGATGIEELKAHPFFVGIDWVNP